MALGAGHVAARAARKQAEAASSWRYDSKLEALATMKRERPDAYNRIAPTLKMALGHYQAGKEAAQAEGMDTTGGNR